MFKQAILIKKSNTDIYLSRSIVEMIEDLPYGNYKIIIEDEFHKCSISQRKLMWMWFTCMSYDTGSTVKEFHDYYCKKYLDEDFTSTKNLSTEQMSRLLDYIQSDALCEFRIRLPGKEDLSFNDFVRSFKHK